MPDKILDLQIQSGRIIDDEEKIDDRQGFTIKSTPLPVTTITSDPTEANVYINDEYVGKTTYSSTEIKAGDSITIRKEGYYETGLTIFQEGIGTTIHFDLEPIAGTQLIDWSISPTAT